MKQITNIRKAVCIMANELKKAGYSLSEAFKKAWQRVNLSMTVRARGTSFGNRQECLRFIKQFRLDDLSVTLEKEPRNKFDSNAITNCGSYPSHFQKDNHWICTKGVGKGAFQGDCYRS